jgi:hypothetical protein
VPLGILASLLLFSCVIPPSLEVEKQDAGANSPPAIVMVTNAQGALPDPGPVLVNVGQTAGDLNLSLIDTDLSDGLYVRIFVDYNMPNRLGPRATCMAPPSTNAMRTTTCSLFSLCTKDDVGVQRIMSIVVFDRMPIDNSDQEPAFQVLPMGGLSTSRTYFLQCQPMPPA